MYCVKAAVSGRVQGVGFRYFVKGCADAGLIRGYAKNLPDGRVEILLQGEQQAIERIIEQIHQGPPYSSVVAVEIEEVEVREIDNYFNTL